MEQLNYYCSITANVSVRQAFEAINNQVSEWWTRDFEGSSGNLDDIFTVRFGDAAVTIKADGFVPLRKILWRVVDCDFGGLNNHAAWKDTKIIWQLLPGNNSTEIKMTHIGLVADIECYHDSVKYWDGFVKENLLNLLNLPKKLRNIEEYSTELVEA